MGQHDDVLSAITRIHAAGLDPARWPEALAAVTELIGGHGASLEIIGRPMIQHQAMYSHGLPAVGDYLDHYASICPRVPFALGQKTGSIIHEALWTDEAGMNSNPFYMEFLAHYDMRYSVFGVISNSPHELTISGVQISPRQGPPTRAELGLMATLLPHIQQATDVMRRLGKTSETRVAFEHTLEWLVDGVVTVARDGAVLYANAAARTVLQADDGITIQRGALRFGAADARHRFGAAMRALARLRDGNPIAEMPSDFLVGRRSGVRDYLVSVRPLHAEDAAAAVALLFIRDPVQREISNAKLLARLFKLTAAEAEVANALCLGLSPGEYARRTNVSSNTVYTHIRRLKDKIGARRMAELIRKLNDAKAAVVAERRT